MSTTLLSLHPNPHPKVATVVLEAAAEPEVIAVAPVVHVCGDGVLTTEEGCDDGAKVAGDGCSRNCTVEPGYVW